MHSEHVCVCGSLRVGVSMSTSPISLCTSRLFGATVMLLWAGGFMVGSSPVTGDNLYCAYLALFLWAATILAFNNYLVISSNHYLNYQIAFDLLDRGATKRKIAVAELVRLLSFLTPEARWSRVSKYSNNIRLSSELFNWANTNQH